MHLEGVEVDVMHAEIPLLVAVEKAEVEGFCVSNVVDYRVSADLRRMGCLLPGSLSDS